MNNSSPKLKSHFSISNFYSLPSMRKKFSSNSFTKVINKIKFKNDEDSDSTDIDSDIDDTIIDLIDEDEGFKSKPLSNITNIQGGLNSPCRKISPYRKVDITPISSPNNSNASSDDHDQPNSPTIRPDRRIRRIHSLYQTTKEKESYQILENKSNLINSGIKTFNVSNDLFPRISCNELSNLINLKNTFFNEVLIVDCRFNYEYNGGHIKSAISLSDKSLLSKFFDNNKSDKKQLVVFHCEFSILRGPTMAQQFRKLDRQINIDNYPYLSYPDILILDGGYSKFYSSYQSLCDGNYIEMKNINYEKLCDLEIHKVKQDSKLIRAKSYNHFNLNSASNSNLFYNHSRSRSYTTITSEKVLKRQKSNSKVITSPIQSKQSLSRSSLTYTNVESIFNSPVNSGFFDDIDFQPPSTSFGPSHRKSNSSSYSNFSLSNSSINSSMSSISSDTDYNNSTDSLAETSSPTGECSEYFEKIATFHSTSSIPLKAKALSRKSTGNLQLRKSTSFKDCSQTLQQPVVQSSQPAPFQFPYVKSKNSRPNLRSINTSHKPSSTPSLLNSSPITSPSLNGEKSGFSTIESSNISHHLSSIIDPINDAPVDFAVPSSFIGNKQLTNSTQRNFNNHTRKRSGSLLSSAGGGLYNFVSLDIDEIDEENEDEDDGVLQCFKNDGSKIVEEDEQEIYENSFT